MYTPLSTPMPRELLIPVSSEVPLMPSQARRKRPPSISLGTRSRTNVAGHREPDLELAGAAHLDRRRHADDLPVRVQKRPAELPGLRGASVHIMSGIGRRRTRRALAHAAHHANTHEVDNRNGAADGNGQLSRPDQLGVGQLQRLDSLGICGVQLDQRQVVDRAGPTTAPSTVRPSDSVTLTV